MSASARIQKEIEDDEETSSSSSLKEESIPKTVLLKEGAEQRNQAPPRNQTSKNQMMQRIFWIWPFNYNGLLSFTCLSSRYFFTFLVLKDNTKYLTRGQ